MPADLRAAGIHRRESARLSSIASAGSPGHRAQMRAMTARFREVANAAHDVLTTEISDALALELRTKADLIDMMAQLASRTPA